MVETILARIACGESLATICKDKDTPAISTVFKWLSENPELSDRYARARSAQADFKFEQITEITERVLRGEVDPHAGRVAIDAYKWQAGKLRPQVYGDRVEHVVRAGRPDELTDDELTRIAAPTMLITQQSEDAA